MYISVIIMVRSSQLSTVPLQQREPIICYDTITIVLCTTGNYNDWL